MAGGYWRDHSEDELANAADEGLRGQGALVEALRRHCEATNSLDRKMWWLGIVGTALAFVGVVLAFIHVWAPLR